MKRKFYTLRDAQDRVIAELTALLIIQLDEHHWEIDLGPEIQPARVELPEGFNIREMCLFLTTAQQSVRFAISRQQNRATPCPAERCPAFSLS